MCVEVCRNIEAKKGYRVRQKKKGKYYKYRYRTYCSAPTSRLGRMSPDSQNSHSTRCTSGCTGTRGCRCGAAEPPAVVVAVVALGVRSLVEKSRFLSKPKKMMRLNFFSPSSGFLPQGGVVVRQIRKERGGFLRNPDVKERGREGAR